MGRQVRGCESVNEGLKTGGGQRTTISGRVPDKREWSKREREKEVGTEIQRPRSRELGREKKSVEGERERRSTQRPRTEVVAVAVQPTDTFLKADQAGAPIAGQAFG